LEPLAPGFLLQFLKMVSDPYQELRMSYFWSASQYFDVAQSCRKINSGATRNIFHLENIFAMCLFCTIWEKNTVSYCKDYPLN
jgi:hypothetical protein